MTKIRDILIISAVLFGLAFVFGCDEESEYPKFQYSEVEWVGPISEDFFEYMRWKAQIDYECGEWHISCPKDGYAYIEQRCDGWTIKNFHYNCMAELTRVACNKCLYPVGRDWKIIDLVEPNEPR